MSSFPSLFACLISVADEQTQKPETESKDTVSYSGRANWHREI
jgi:hypothetical protein